MSHTHITTLFVTAFKTRLTEADKYFVKFCQVKTNTF